MSRKRVPLNQNECTADFRIGVPFEQNLHQYGLLEQDSDETEVYYIFSGFGKALKGNCLNYGDDTKCEVFKTYNDVSPLSISEPALMGDIKQLFIEEVDS